MRGCSFRLVVNYSGVSCGIFFRLFGATSSNGPAHVSSRICIVVDGPKQTVYCYDSTNKRANHNLLAELADELVKKSLPQGYSITPIHNPIQKDGYNCGLFICLYFWRRFWKEAGSDYTETGLVRRRWDVMHLIVEFSDGSKEKETVAA
ncbi:hypothetical protein F441_05942 [Phytophthora nicotianae CJ01A1]|uniref:Ubiquitin-like protease family profile domain-containing protein n=2 Tax=Phytophthora nicotianae TaxID=4792 RepID=V9FGF1_PHYNI|nr:hypothetical protein F443_05938 [Phytophthora nicotianae P1569]ETP20321.1 hypothetical protein F441_05942 [Phytophthora nicotianae CJ01A1]